MPQCHCVEHPVSNLQLHYDQTHKWYEGNTFQQRRHSHGLGILDYLVGDKRPHSLYGATPHSLGWPIPGQPCGR